MVTSQLRILVAEKATEERRMRLPGINTIVKESGASRATVQRLLNGTIKNVPLDDLGLLCRWLGKTPGDILRLDA